MPKKHICSAKDVVNNILDRDIVWTEWKTLPEEHRKQWGADARSLLENRVFQSLVGKSGKIYPVKTNGELVKRFIESIARYSKSHEETEHIRMNINTLELLRDEVEEMLWNQEQESTEDLNAAV